DPTRKIPKIQRKILKIQLERFDDDVTGAGSVERARWDSKFKRFASHNSQESNSLAIGLRNQVRV
ncbi:MAG: hypothetical protein RLZZ69_741, partial [Cyanobacteriota bacterium]